MASAKNAARSTRASVNAGEAKSEAKDISKWPTKALAARKVGVHTTTLMRMVDQDELHPQRDENGHWRFDPEELEKFIPEEPESDVFKAQTEFLGEATAYVKQMATQTDRMFEHSQTRTELLFQKYTDVLALLAEQNQKLIAEKFKTIDALESALTMRHERDIALEQARAKEARRAELVQAVGPAAAAAVKRLVPQIAATLGMGPDPRVEMLSRLANRVGDDEAKVFAAMVGMTADEWAIFQSAREQPCAVEYSEVAALIEAANKEEPAS